MSEKGGSGTGTENRGGKYCPRCQTMAFRDQAVCAYCGHQFRSTAAPSPPPPIAPTRVPDDLHRTQQFTLPPLPRTPPPAAEMPPPISPAPRPPLPRSPAIWAMWLCLLIAGMLAGAFIFSRLHHPPTAPTPAGAWATTLRGTGAAAQSADLKFVFAADGGGTYALGTAPPAPLHWMQTGNTLTLTLTPPTPPEAQYATLVTIFNGRPWVWKRDSARRTLTLGTLTFTQIPTETL